jgi:hypothetical protein
MPKPMMDVRMVRVLVFQFPMLVRVGARFQRMERNVIPKTARSTLFANVSVTVALSLEQADR